MNSKIVEAKLIKCGNSLRLSIYFDYYKDNHHLQFAQDATRYDIVMALQDLADLIIKGAKLK